MIIIPVVSDSLTVTANAICQVYVYISQVTAGLVYSLPVKTKVLICKILGSNNDLNALKSSNIK
ncbi:hypothetical protein E2C01_019496 [Portunus trituberculatus]|uniref:Uncharacterized protein n=1 Tax=Portunus trituberculatus TaxID=210409 RepID=A0A5B7DXD2_PORTR|nr:hypothetical protein [Portunus trituberculatus]